MRFPLRALCTFFWNSPESGLSSGSGWTSDLNLDGVCVHVDSGPLPTGLVSVEISLPRSAAAAGTFAPRDVLLLIGEGRVVRHDQLRSHFAAQVSFANWGLKNEIGWNFPLGGKPS